MRDRTFYAGLIPVGAVAFGVAVATMRPAAIDNTSHAEIVAVVTVNAPEVVIQYPTATTTPTVAPTETPWPTDVPLPTWGGQHGDGLYVIPAVTATPKPPFVYKVCARATPIVSSDLICQAIPFDLPGGLFS